MSMLYEESQVFKRKIIMNTFSRLNMERLRIGKTSDIPSGKMTKLKIAEREILVANIEGNYYAIDDTCTHSGASLSEGKLNGPVVTCGWHGAEFDCKTGKLAKFPVKIRDLKSYNVIVEVNDVFIEV